jgi:hypothetical protein
MSIETPTLEEIVKEPSAEVLTDYYNKYVVTGGKFVRIGHVILIAPLLRLAPESTYPYHIELMMAASDNPDETLSKRVNAARQAVDHDTCLKYSDLTDAGMYLANFSNTDELTQVDFRSDSTVYGRADEAGRNETIAIMRGYILDPIIEVTGR